MKISFLVVYSFGLGSSFSNASIGFREMPQKIRWLGVSWPEERQQMLLKRLNISIVQAREAVADP